MDETNTVADIAKIVSFMNFYLNNSSLLHYVYLHFKQML